MKGMISLISVLSMSFAAQAIACPDFSGKYKTTYPNGDFTESTFTQIGCNKITSIEVSTENGQIQPAVVIDLAIDGSFRDMAPGNANGTAMTAITFADDALVLTEVDTVYVPATYDTQASLGSTSTKTRVALDASRNIVTTAQSYNSEGTLISTQSVTSVRE